MFTFLCRNKSFAVSPSGNTVTGSLPKLFLLMYGFDHFSICSNNGKHSFIFDFDRKSYDKLSPSMVNNLYDSVFYTFCSMFLTRSERDKFIKLFRRG